MKGRKQKISEDTYPKKNRAELEGYVGGHTFLWITENKHTDIDQKKIGLLELILSPSNMNELTNRLKAIKEQGD